MERALDALAAAGKVQSFGLLGVRERTCLLGGELRITSAPGKGTEVEARLPLAAT